MSSVETGQMSAVETGQMTAAETSVLSQQKTVKKHRVFVCLSSRPKKHPVPQPVVSGCLTGADITNISNSICESIP